MSGALWRVALAAPEVVSAEAAAAAFDAALGTVSAFELEPGGAWQIESISLTRPDRTSLEIMLALIWPAGVPPALVIERVEARDWLAENRAGFPPIAVGRYFIHGSHETRTVPAGRIGLLIDAATAFGTGEHATTQGCLLALDRLARRRRFRRVLDMGTGTGILALAAAKTWRRIVAARDIDPESVRVARLNARANGVASLVRVLRGAGYRDRALKRRAPFDLVFANILARPLMAMALGLGGALEPGGVAILSGLLARQEKSVLAAHRLRGLRLVRRVAIGGWHTLVLTRGWRVVASSADRP